MSPITLRNVPAHLARAILKRSRERDLSLNKAVISLLEEALGAAPGGEKTPHYTDLDHLAGRWSREEAAIFEKSLADQRRIDPGLWK